MKLNKVYILLSVLLGILLFLIVAYYGTSKKVLDEEKLPEFEYRNKGEKFLTTHYLNSLKWDDEGQFNAITENPYIVTHAIKHNYKSFIDFAWKDKLLDITYNDFSYLIDAIKVNNVYAFKRLLLRLDVSYYSNEIEMLIRYAFKYKNEEILRYLLQKNELSYTLNQNTFNKIVDLELFELLDLFKEKPFIIEKEQLEILLKNGSVLNKLILTYNFTIDYTEENLTSLIKHDNTILVMNYYNTIKKDKLKVTTLKNLIKKSNHKNLKKELNIK